MTRDSSEEDEEEEEEEEDDVEGDVEKTQASFFSLSWQLFVSPSFRGGKAKNVFSSF